MNNAFKMGMAVAIVGLVISTAWMRVSEDKWPSLAIQRSVLGALFLTGVAVYIVGANGREWGVSLPIKN